MVRNFEVMTTDKDKRSSPIKAYKDKYFLEGEDYSDYHQLNIWLNKNCTKEDLENLGFVNDTGEFICDEEGNCHIPLSVPLRAELSADEAEEEGIPPIPKNWKDEVPTCLGLKPEWIDGVSMDG